MEITVLAWNLFHGRDFPPDPALRTWRSRLLRLDEHNETHVQVNRDLTKEFATLLAGTAWDVGREYTGNDASGYGVRLLTALARSFAA